MALKTERKQEMTPEVAAQTTVLELALYKKYTWQGFTYEANKPYRFKNTDAMMLLNEQDLGRPVWRIYRPPVARRQTKAEIVDATDVQVAPPVDEFGVVKIDSPNKRIDIGNDDEIADILNKPEQNAEGDVTV